MSGYWSTADRSLQIGTAYDFADSTTPMVFQPGRPAEVKRLVLVITELTAGTSVITVALRSVDDTGSTNLGTITVPAGLALNTVVKIDLAKVTSTAVTTDGTGISQVADVTLGRVNGRQISEPGVITVLPGQELSFTSDGNGTGGIANAYIEFSDWGNQPDNFDTSIDFVLA